MVIVLAQFSLIQQPFFVPSLSHPLVPSGCNVRPEREIMNGYQVSTALNSADIVPRSLVLSTSRPPSSRTEYSTETSELCAPVLNPFVTPPRYTYWWRELEACQCQRVIHKRKWGVAGFASPVNTRNYFIRVEKFNIRRFGVTF